MRPFPRLLSVLYGLQLFALFCAAMANIEAATLTVTDTNDSGPGSLRQALTDVADGDTIRFDAALNGQTISLTSDELGINKNITVSGPGPDILAVRGIFTRFRIFHVMPGHTAT